MNRIYQGRVTRMERLGGSPLPLSALWDHHCIFQDAVNYYFLALAAMAPSDGSPLCQWAGRVRESWRGLATLPQLEADFDPATARVLAPSHATPEQRAAALQELLAMKGDLNQIAVNQLPWFSTPHGQLDKASRAVSSMQEVKRQTVAKAIHAADPPAALKLGAELDLNVFFAQPPVTTKTGAEAEKQVRNDLKKLCHKYPGLQPLQTAILAAAVTAVLPKGNKPSGFYPAAEIFKLHPCPETLETFRLATKSLAEGKDKQAAGDPIAASRVQDEPHFDYFTNLLLGKGSNRAAWFEFDLAAFVEALKAPRRYLEDTQERNRKAAALRGDLEAMEGRGRGPGRAEEDQDEGGGLPGFAGDARIDLLRSLVTGALARSTDDGASEYRIRRRTLRGWPDVRERWRSAVGAGKADPPHLIAIAAGEQGDHRDDFGSAELFQALAQPAFQPIWRSGKSEDWHADDPLQAWLQYTDLQAELEKLSRPIRFTPAHPELSPRFFIFPKAGVSHLAHEAAQFSFTASLIVSRERTPVRVFYAAPRLRRDSLRTLGSGEDLAHEPWLQPMMEALGRKPQSVDFANCAATLLAEQSGKFHLSFPVDVTPFADNGWRMQCNIRPDGKQKRLYSLRWPHEKQPAKLSAPPWYDQPGFACLAVDLGQRDAGAFARLEISPQIQSAKATFIGHAGERDWFAAVDRAGLIRLPGEDARVWRARSAKDSDSTPGVARREELWGERGRAPRGSETQQAVALLQTLGSPEMTEEVSAISFPLQNDKLLVALRRFQSRIARLQRWHLFLSGNDAARQAKAWEEAAACDDERVLGAEQRAWAQTHDPRLRGHLHTEAGARLGATQAALQAIASRILPSRGKHWQWQPHPQSTTQKPLFELALLAGRDAAAPPVWLRGQRGLSLERIEQVRELRQRAQSLNAAARRHVTGEPVTRRDHSVPDSCPDILQRLDRLRRERTRQTAHAILAEALGLQLKRPPMKGSAERLERDLHGTYEKVAEPVQMIVIEDLSRYRSDQGRAPRENSRLMQWCHRELRDKLLQLCEVFGIPIIEAPAAYSSRFCSRTGAAGFRALEVTVGFTRSPRWSWLAAKKNKQGTPTADAIHLLGVDQQLGAAQAALAARKPGKRRTLLVPAAGGPIFVPINAAPDADGIIRPPLQQADINAAMNLALRAVGDPHQWRIAPRLRTERKGKKILAREKRKFLDSQPEVTLSGAAAGEDSRPNLFADFAGLHGARLCSATLAGVSDVPPLLTGKSLWGYVKENTWPTIHRVNATRLRRWETEEEKRKGAAF